MGQLGVGTTLCGGQLEVGTNWRLGLLCEGQLGVGTTVCPTSGGWDYCGWDYCVWDNGEVGATMCGTIYDCGNCMWDN